MAMKTLISLGHIQRCGGSYHTSRDGPPTLHVFANPHTEINQAPLHPSTNLYIASHQQLLAAKTTNPHLYSTPTPTHPYRPPPAQFPYQIRNYMHNLAYPMAPQCNLIQLKPLTTDQRKRAAKALVLHEVQAHPPDDQLCAELNSGKHSYTYLTCKDVRHMRQLNGPCADCLAGRGYRPAAVKTPSVKPRADTPGAQISFDLNVLPSNVLGGFTQKVTMVDVASGHISQPGSRSKNTPDVFSAMKDTIATTYNANDHKVHTLTGDSEPINNSLITPFGSIGIKVLTKLPGTHEPIVERSTQTINDRSRAVASGLPYHLPPELVLLLDQSVGEALNNTVNSASAPQTPNEIVLGFKPTQATIPFGRVGMVTLHDDKRQSIAKKTLTPLKKIPLVELAVSMGPKAGTDRTQWLLANGHVVPRKLIGSLLSRSTIPFNWTAKPVTHTNPATLELQAMQTTDDPIDTLATVPKIITQQVIQLPHAHPADALTRMNPHLQARPLTSPLLADLRHPQHNLTPAPSTTTSVPDAPSSLTTPVPDAPSSHHLSTPSPAPPSATPTPPPLTPEPTAPPTPQPPLQSSQSQVTVTTTPPSPPSPAPPPNPPPRPPPTIPHSDRVLRSNPKRNTILSMTAQTPVTPTPPSTHLSRKLLLIKAAAVRDRNYRQAHPPPPELNNRKTHIKPNPPPRQQNEWPILKALKVLPAASISAAIDKETNKVFHKYKSLRLIPLTSIEPNALHVRSKMFVREKTDHSVTSRIVLDGGQQPPDTYAQTHAGTSDAKHQLVALAIGIADATHRGVIINSFDFDIEAAFINGNKLPRELTGGRQIITTLPKELDPPYGGSTAEVDGAHYGLKQSNHIFEQNLNETLAEINLLPCASHPRTYHQQCPHNPLNSLTLSMTVDDGTGYYTSTFLYEQLKQKIIERYGPTTFYSPARGTCGQQQITNPDGSITTHYGPHITKMLHTEGMDDVPAALSPEVKGLFDISIDPTPLNAKDTAIFQRRNGKLIFYLPGRHDIKKTLTYLLTKNDAPDNSDQEKQLHLLRYLKGAPNLGPTFSSDPADYPNGVEITSSCDSSTNAHQDGSSHQAYLITIGKPGANSSPCASYSAKEKGVSLSPLEAEYVTLSKTSKQVIHLRQFAEDLGHPQHKPTIMLEDNNSAIKLTSSPVIPAKSSHIALKHHHVRWAMKTNQIQPIHQGTQDMIPDSMTKYTGPSRFLYFRSKVFTTPLTPLTRLHKSNP